MKKKLIGSTMDIAIYSDDKTVRSAIIKAAGVRPAKGFPKLTWWETATAHGLQMAIHDGDFPVAVVDAEATKISGLVAAKTIAYEEENVPIFVALIARPQDSWLADFSQITYTIMRPFNPIEVQKTLAKAIWQAAQRRKAENEDFQIEDVMDPEDTEFLKQNGVCLDADMK